MPNPKLLKNLFFNTNSHEFLSNCHKFIRGNSSQIRGNSSLIRDHSCQNIFFNLSKLYLISLIFFFSFILSTLAKAPPPITLDLPQPWRTECLNKEVKDNKNHYVINGKYKSQLSQKEIFDFYNDIFSRQGMKLNHSFAELKDDYIKTFFFKLGIIKNVTLSMFTSNIDERFTIYFLSVLDTKDLLSVSRYKLEPPRPQAFMPVYSNAKQFGYSEKHKNIFLGLIPADAKDVVDFYLKEMPQRKWNLVSRKNCAGRYNLFVALTMGSSDLPQLPMKLEEYTPGVEVEVEGSSLEFERGKERCIISIIKFWDDPQTLKTMRIDPAPLEKYGRILFSAAYYEK